MYSASSDEQTESSTSCRDDIIAMLSASGYHRARITCLNDYDRIVGGIAWAITRYDDVEVAANLLYEESEDQNIKLRTEQSEKIIEALNAVECPHKIFAHQLFGLDFVALKNVVQWLLRRVLAQDGKENKYQHFTQWFALSHSSIDEALQEYRRRLRRPNENRIATTRHMKRFDSSVIFDLALDAKCTLAEYVVYSKTGERIYHKEEENTAAVGETENLQETSTKKHVPTSTVRELMEQAVVDNFQNDPESVKKAREEICTLIDEFNIPQRLSVLENRLVDEASSFYRAKKHNEELNERYSRIIAQVVSSDQIDLEQMAEIMKSFQLTQTRAQELRTFVVVDLERAQKHEDLLRQNVDENGKVQKYCVHKREIMEKWTEKTRLIGDTVRDVLALQFRLDRILGVTLSSHYRKRNMERLIDSSELTQGAKTAVIDYNVTIDILTFSTKITGFINEVEKSLLAEPASQEYRDAFVSYMNDVRTQLGEYHWKAKLTQDKTIAEKQKLAALRATIRLKEREVAYTSGEMKKLLEMNNALQEVANSLAEIEAISPAYQCSEAKKAAGQAN